LKKGILEVIRRMKVLVDVLRDRVYVLCV